MIAYEHLIDLTTIAAVRRHLEGPSSPIHEVLFVAEPLLLPAVARTLDPATAESSQHRLHRWRTWVENGAVVPRCVSGYGVDLDRLAGERRCRVIFLPPVYLVHVHGLDLGQHLARAA